MTILEDRPADPPHLRKARGAFFTPPEVCEFVAGWALRTPTDRVLEPSCGEADFLLATSTLAPQAVLRGVDIHAASITAATRRLQAAGVRADLEAVDFFDEPGTGSYDAVIGNPPYVRFHGWTGSARLRSLEAAQRSDVELGNLASSWAAFTVAAAEHLRPDGRLGLVLPAELLSVSYAEGVRQWLLRRFAAVRLVLFRERVFPGVSEEVVLLLAEGQGPTDGVHVQEVRDLVELQTLEAPSGPAWGEAHRSSKWMRALASTAAADVEGLGSRFVPLSTWGIVRLGMVTGSNRFFVVEGHEAEAFETEDLVPISAPGSTHLRALELTKVQWRKMGGAYLFRPVADTVEELKGAALKRVLRGLDDEVDQAYKCRVRSPWWQTPLVPPPDLFLTYMSDKAPGLCHNPSKLRHLNSVHGVYLGTEDRHLASALALAALNSVTLLSAELEGRSYGGGMLKLEPREATRLSLPSAAVVTVARPWLLEFKAQARRRLLAGQLEEVVATVDEELLRKRLRMTRRDLRAVQATRLDLLDRRTTRSGGRRL